MVKAMTPARKPIRIVPRPRNSKRPSTSVTVVMRTGDEATEPAATFSICADPPHKLPYAANGWTIGFFGAVYAGILSSYCAKLLLTIASIDPKWHEEWPRFPDGRDVRLFIIMLGALGNTFVPWSALASVGIVLALSSVKIVSRLIYYRQRMEYPPH